jgi:hypothetical protein
MPTIEWIAVDALKPNVRNARTTQGRSVPVRRSKIQPSLRSIRRECTDHARKVKKFI